MPLVSSEILYPEWLANIVVVPKRMANGECVNYSNLNDACLKDMFPLPHIDQIVDATARHELLSFLDAYSGYNQIPMFPPTWQTRLGLKNAEATYQRMMSHIFEPLLGKTMEAYIDNMLVKSNSREDLLAHEHFTL